MAQVDTSIYNRLQPVQIESPLESYGKVAQFKAAQQQNKLAELALGQKQREISGDNALASLLSSGKSGADVATGLAQQGYGAKSMDYTKQQSALTKQQREAEKAELENSLAKQKTIAQYAGAAKDQATWSQGLAELQSMGIDVSKVPQQFDPKTAAVLRDRSMTGVQQIEQVWKQKGYDLDVSKFGETQRHNRTQEGIAGGNLSVARQNVGLRGQELAQKTAGANKPLPVGALKLSVEAQDAADTAAGINERLTNVEKRIADGKLSFGPLKNAVNSGLNMAGMSTEESRNFSSFKSDLEKMRNDSLRLNKGVQTDGDAQRAWNELMQNINDTALVKQRLAEIKQINERAKNLQLMEVDTINRNYGRTSEAAPSKVPARSNVDDLLKKYGG